MIDRQTYSWPDGLGGFTIYEAYEILYLEAPARFCEVVLTANLAPGIATADVLFHWGAAPNEKHPGSPIVVYDRQNQYAHVKAGSIMTVVYDELFIDPQNAACGRYVPLYVGPAKLADVCVACDDQQWQEAEECVEDVKALKFDKTPGFQIFQKVVDNRNQVFLRLMKLSEAKLLATDANKTSLVQTDCPHAGVSLTLGRTGQNLGYVRWWPENGQPLYIAAAENMINTLKWRMSSANTGELATGSHPFARKVKDSSIVETHWTRPGLDGELVIRRLPIRLTFDHGLLVECSDWGIPYPYSYSLYLPDASSCPAKPQNDSSVSFTNPPCSVEDPCAQQ